MSHRKYVLGFKFSLSTIANLQKQSVVCPKNLPKQILLFLGGGGSVLKFVLMEEFLNPLILNQVFDKALNSDF